MQIPFEKVLEARLMTWPAVVWIVFSSVLVFEEGEKLVNTGTVVGLLWLQMYSSVHVNPEASAYDPSSGWKRMSEEKVFWSVKVPTFFSACSQITTPGGISPKEGCWDRIRWWLRLACYWEYWRSRPFGR